MHNRTSWLRGFQILSLAFVSFVAVVRDLPAATPQDVRLDSTTHRPLGPVSAIDFSTTTVTFGDAQIPQSKVNGLTTALSNETSVRAAADTAESSTRAAADTAINSAIALKAADSATVHNTGNETIAGTKTFSSAPAVPDNSFAESKVASLVTDLAALNSAIALKAADSATVHNTGNETIAGTKTFSSAPAVPDNSFTESKVTNLLTDLAAKAADSATVHNTGNETIAGTKTFSSAPTVPDNSFAESKVTNLLTDLAAKAADSAVVHNTGNESIAGNKTFAGANVFTSLQTFNAIASRSITTSQLANAGAPTVTPIGANGATTWTYKIVAKLSDGTPSAAGAAGSTAIGDDVLDATNKNSLTWSAVTGAASYDVYRTAVGVSPTTTGKIANVTSTSYIDAGAAGDGATAPSTNATGAVNAYSLAGKGESITLTVNGTGAIARTLGAHANETVNVKDFGAVGDGATNDTAAINLARAQANATAQTLLFPPGTYLVTQGALGDFTSSIEGPDAVIQAAAGGSGVLISTDYNEAAGCAFRTFRLKQISGVPFTYVGTGLYLKHGDYSHFWITDLRWFSKGIHLDGWNNNSHVAANDFHIGNLFVCDDGIVMWSGTGSYWCEVNRIYVNYSQGHRNSAITIGQSDGSSAAFTANASTDLLATTAHGLTAGTAVTFTSTGTLPGGLSAGTVYYVIASGLTADVFKVSATVGGSAVDITSTGSGVHSWSRYFTAVHNNFIEFMALEANQVTDSNGIICLGDCKENDISARVNFGGSLGTNGKDLKTSGSNNHYQLATLNWSRITVTGSEIFDTAAFAKDDSARSVTRGSTAPATAYHRIGDIQWNNASTYPAGWYCTVAGTPGTWQPILVGTDTPAVPAIAVNTFANSWVNFGAGRRDASYWKDPLGMVHLVGFIKSGTVTDGTTMFTLPVGYRPGATEIFDGLANNLHCTIQVGSDGNVQVFSAAGNNSLGIPNIQFRPD